MGEIRSVGTGETRGYPYLVCKNISIFHVCMVWIGKPVTRDTDRHHEACRYWKPTLPATAVRFFTLTSNLHKVTSFSDVTAVKTQRHLTT